MAQIPKRRADRDALLKLPRYHRLLTDVAEQLGVTQPAVTHTWHRPRTSKRIRLAIEQELARRSAAEQVAS